MHPHVVKEEHLAQRRRWTADSPLSSTKEVVGLGRVRGCGAVKGRIRGSGVSARAFAVVTAKTAAGAAGRENREKTRLHSLVSTPDSFRTPSQWEKRECEVCTSSYNALATADITFIFRYPTCF